MCLWAPEFDVKYLPKDASAKTSGVQKCWQLSEYSNWLNLSTLMSEILTNYCNGFENDKLVDSSKHLLWSDQKLHKDDKGEMGK